MASGSRRARSSCPERLALSATGPCSADSPGRRDDGARSPLIIALDDATLRARLESELATPPLAHAIVTADVSSIAALRADHPRAAILAAGLRRGEIAAALDAGADTAVAGWPPADELRARLRAVARRREPPLRVGPLELHPWARAARLEGAALDLRGREFDLLACLASAPGTVFTKDQLVRRCWGAPAALPAPAPRGRALERCLSRLRRRLGRHAPMLVTVWGIGYRLAEPD